MSVPFSTLIVAVYTLVDTWLLDHPEVVPCRRRGGPPRMTDAEVITLALIGQRCGNSESHVLALIQQLDPTAFPRLLGQRQFNERVRALHPAMARLMVDLSGMLDRATTPVEVADAVSVPVVRPFRAAHGARLEALVSGGIGGSSRSFYLGCQLLTAVTQAGAITGFVLGSARTEGHWLLEWLFQLRHDPASVPRPPEAIGSAKPAKGPDKPILGQQTAGQPAVSETYTVDNGFRGAWWHRYWATIQAYVVLDGGPRAPLAQRTAHHRRRQIVEQVNGILKASLHLEYPGAKTVAGILTRITAKCCMHNLAMVINQRLGRNLLQIGTLIRF